MHHSQPTAKHSRSRRRHRHSRRHEACHSSDEDGSSVSSNAKDHSADKTAKDPVPRVSTWSEPVLDTQSSGRFQYQFRLTPHAYQWTISGPDSGINPQYLSIPSNPSTVHPLDTTSATYPASPYVLDQTTQSQPQYYGPSNVDVSPYAPLANGGDRNYRAEEYYEDEIPHDRSMPRRNKLVNGHRSEKKGEKRGEKHHHRSHSHHRVHSPHYRQHHHRSKSHEDNNHQKHTGRRDDRGIAREKINEWLYNYEYTDR